MSSYGKARTTSRSTAWLIATIVFVLGFFGSLTSCELLTSSEKTSSPATGAIEGSARYRNAEDHGGIIISIEASDGLRTSSLGTVSALATTTDADGSFRIEELAPGTYTVYAVSSYSEEGAVTTTVEVTASETTAVEPLELSPVADITGTVRLDESFPEGTVFEVFIPGTSYSGRTGSDGSFRIRGVPAFNEYPLLIAQDGAYLDPQVAPVLSPGPNELEEAISLSSADVENAAGLTWQGTSAGAPADPVYGWAYWDTEDRRVLIYDGGAWYPLGAGAELYSRWDVALDIPAAFSTTEGNPPWYLVAHFGDGELSAPEEFSPDEPVSLRIPHGAETSSEPVELYLFVDETGDGSPQWLEEPVVYLGSHDPTRYQYLEHEIIRLTGTIAPLTGAASSYPPEELVVEVRFPEAGVSQWTSVTTEDLAYDIWVRSGAELTMSARHREGDPESFADASWRDNLGYPVPLGSADQYWSSQTIVTLPPPGTDILIVWHPDDDQSVRDWDPQYRPLLWMVKNVLDYAGLAYQDVPITELDRIDLDRFGAVVFTTERIWAMGASQTAALTQRVKQGMGVVFGKRGYRENSEPFDELVGITGYDGFDGADTTAELCFTEEWLPGLEGLCLPEDQTRYSRMKFDLDPAVMVLANAPDRSPLAWRHGYGSGRTFFWNTDLTEYAQYRGLLLHSILDVLPVGAAPTANAGVFHIDDYPLPVFADQALAPTALEYGTEDDPRKNYEFYRETWLPDMLSLAGEFGMEYLFAIPFNYTLNTTPDPAGWSFAQWEGDESTQGTFRGSDVPFGVAEAAKIRAAGHELSLHGYNHRSLLGDAVNSGESNYWLRDGGSIATMRTSVEAARQRWLADDLGPLPVSYVAPNNRIDSTGLTVLRQAFPELRIFAGDITIPYDQGGRIDFGPDPVDPHFFSLPRWTSGFYNTDQTRLYAVSQLALAGVWTHFVHPDDIYDLPDTSGLLESGPTRNPDRLPWGGAGSTSGPGLYQELQALLQWNRDNYPWLQWLTTVQAVDRIERALNTPVYWEHDPFAQSLTATFEGEPEYLWVRLSGSKRLDEDAVHGATVEWRREHAPSSSPDNGYALYLLSATSSTVDVGYTQ